MAGYHSQRKEESSESLAQLTDRCKGFNESELGILVRFAELIQETHLDK